MASNTSFFESPQAAAIYKHNLLKGYIPAWAGKVGSTAAGGRVFVYDAYSGPGRYANDEPGSPELLVDTALEMAKLRSVVTVFSEKEKTHCDKLRDLLVAKGVPSDTYVVREGPVEEHLDDVLGIAGTLPLFVFLDPFGLTVSFDRVVHILSARMNLNVSPALQPKTELLMNFSYEAVRRIAGVLRSEKEYAAKSAQIGALDHALGGEWWHEIALREAEGWVQEVLTGYADRVRQAAKCGGYITADVSDSLDAQPVYELILFTRHRDGLWKMMEAMSTARMRWRQWLVDRREEATGQTELRGLDWDDNEDAWIDEIEKNVKAILAKKSGFVLQDELGPVLGRTLGVARTKHIRAALRRLYNAGDITANPKGELPKYYTARS